MDQSDRQIVDVHVAVAHDPWAGAGGWGAVLRYLEHSRELTGDAPGPVTPEALLRTAVISCLEALTRPCVVRIHGAAGPPTPMDTTVRAAAQRHAVTWMPTAGDAPDPATARAERLAAAAMPTAETRCVHDLPTGQCSDCRLTAAGLPRRVAMTRGGTVYHLSAGCRALHEGWNSVVRKGGTPAELEWLPLVDAHATGRGACLVCCSRLDVR